MKQMDMNQPPTLMLAIKRGLLQRCPVCGQGKLFARYLRAVDHCANCGEPLSAIRADDGPAWLTIFLVLHIMAPFLLWVAPGANWPDWLQLIIFPLAALILAIALLPRAKGFFIALIWYMHFHKRPENQA